MKNLFIFGIGGTGSRVIRSLIMLLASGVKINETRVIPIIMDPDESNGDCVRCIGTLEMYQKLYRETKGEAGFFGTPVHTLSDLNEASNSGPSFRLNFKHKQKFSNFIGINSIPSSSTHDFLELLFSKKQFDTQLDGGYYGNPNMGTVILNDILNTDGFKLFNDAFRNSEDRIFIIGSIFGGTGASGYPILANEPVVGLGKL